MRASRAIDAISDGAGLAQHWRVTQLTRLGSRAAGAGPGRSRRLASIARLARRGCAPALAVRFAR